jgi:hypothetical protein
MVLLHSSNRVDSTVTLTTTVDTQKNMPTEASITTRVILPESPEGDCLEGIDQACENSLDFEEVYECIGKDYSRHKFIEAMSNINSNLSQVSVNFGGSILSLMTNGEATSESESFAYITVTCKDQIATSFVVSYGLQPLGKTSATTSSTLSNINRPYKPQYCVNPFDI